MYVRMNTYHGPLIVQVRSVQQDHCEQYPQYDKEIIFHLEHELFVMVPGDVIKNTGAGRHLFDNLFKYNKLPELIDFTTEFWKNNCETWDGYGNDMTEPPEDPECLKKFKENNIKHFNKSN